jgi:hypothetical protein
MEVSFHIYNELMDLERRLIPSLYNNKFFWGGNEWRITNDNVLQWVQIIDFAKAMTIDELSEYVIVVEKKVK